MHHRERNISGGASILYKHITTTFSQSKYYKKYVTISIQKTEQVVYQSNQDVVFLVPAHPT